MKIALDQLILDAGTHCRVGVDPVLVDAFVDQLLLGTAFPPVVVFVTANGSLHHYLADGFHRVAAAREFGDGFIEADVRPGTREEALWFALGANRENGQRLTLPDKTHAITLALRQWPERVQREIAEQVGCADSLVSKIWLRDFQSATGSEPAIRGSALVHAQRRDQARALLAEGMGSVQVSKTLGIHAQIVARLRAEMGLPSYIDRSRPAIAKRLARITEMAAQGCSSRQIEAAIGIGAEHIGKIAKAAGVTIHADKIIAGTHRHNPNRIVDQMALDAANLCADVHLITFADLDPEPIANCLRAFRVAQKQMTVFARRLLKEQQRHGQAAARNPAAETPVEDPAGAHREDAGAAAPGDAAGIPEEPR